jgi:hypothetical protein
MSEELSIGDDNEAELHSRVLEPLLFERVLGDKLEPFTSSPGALKVPFTCSFKYDKATNIAKFLIRIFFEFSRKFEQFLTDDREKPMHLVCLQRIRN